MNNYQLYNKLPDGIFVINSDYKILFWNNMMENFTGKISEEMVGKNLLEIYPHLDKNMYHYRIEQIFLGGPPAIFSSQLHKYIIPCNLPDGKHRRQHTTVSGTKSKDEKDFNAVFSIQDISDEAKRIEEYRVMRKQSLIEIKKRTKAEAELRESNATKDKFFSIISHDLKNPFVTLMGFSEMILSDLDDFTQEELRTYLEEIFKVSKSTFNLLEDLLLWSRSQRDILTLEKEEFSIADCAKQTIITQREIAKRKAIQLINNIPETLNVYADKSSISTVLRNLISNSIKFTEENGSITLSTEEQTDQIVISVSDTGVGIEPDRLDELFQVGAHKSTDGTNKERGTGLGLVLCREFIEKHDGKIWAESEVGKGSHFKISLPIKK